MVDPRRKYPSEAGGVDEFWAAAERNEAKEINRWDLRKWHLSRLREKPNPHPLGRDVHPMPADPSSDATLPEEPRGDQSRWGC